jgi:hypothetical protein
MNTFKINLINGLPVIESGENIILIDTGAPSTIHNDSILNFCSKVYDCSSNFMNLTIDNISDMLGHKITTLLGADIISDYTVFLDYRNQTAIFYGNENINSENEIPITSFMSIPIIELSIGINKIKCFLDTGAKLSYLSPEITANLNSIGNEEDFYPGIGKFQTEVYEVQTIFESQQFIAKYGNLPNILQMTLNLANVNGIIGYDFFNNFKVWLDLKNKNLKYEYFNII